MFSRVRVENRKQSPASWKESQRGRSWIPLRSRVLCVRLKERIAASPCRAVAGGTAGEEAEGEDGGSVDSAVLEAELEHGWQPKFRRLSNRAQSRAHAQERAEEQAETLSETGAGEKSFEDRVVSTGWISTAGLRHQLALPPRYSCNAPPPLLSLQLAQERKFSPIGKRNVWTTVPLPSHPLRTLARSKGSCGEEDKGTKTSSRVPRQRWLGVVEA